MTCLSEGKILASQKVFESSNCFTFSDITTLLSMLLEFHVTLLLIIVILNLKFVGDDN